MNRNKQKKGNQGEQLAKQLLLNKGYEFLCQNFKTRLGEIDLIFKDQDFLVFVEVKTRTQLEQGLPEEAVTPHKLHKISLVAQEYTLHAKLEKLPARIDVVAVELLNSLPQVRHLIDVTGI